ncbi:hypothetical protein BDW59DRAFT_165705 [Aspergillus cavernicola]|uniref:Uncharacterized protein n=1 Tax=Aspergillus cavernicola TaxID=176166 RepID=A0ABR4HR96_9EURO
MRLHDNHLTRILIVKAVADQAWDASSYTTAGRITIKLTFILTLLIPHLLADSIIYPPTPIPELSDITWISDTTGFDGPKVAPANATTWDWWYFDAVQAPTTTGEQAAVVIIFYMATVGKFEFLRPT